MSMKKVLHGIKPRSGSGSNSGHNSDNESPAASTHTANSEHRSSHSRISTGLSSLTHAANGITGGHRKSTDGPSRVSTDLSHRSSIREHGDHRSGTPIGKLRRKLGVKSHSGDDSHSSTEDLSLSQTGESLSKNQLRKHERLAEKEQHRKEAEAKMEEDKKRKQEMERKAMENETEEQKSKYGVLPINNYAGEDKQVEDRTVNIMTLKPEQVGQTVTFRSRIHNMRKVSAHLMFVELRQQTATIQGILHEHELVSQHFLYWAEHLHVETIVSVTGVIQLPKAKQGTVTGVTVGDVELQITEMHVEGTPSEPLPFTVHEAEVTKEETEQEGDTRHRVSERARISNRIIDLRTTAAQAIFRVQSGICQAFRSHLYDLGFTEIHTPKLQGAASESGASVFKVNYFDRPAFLAQSPQLGKQMSIAADLKRVFEIGPVFRAENSNTHRHLTEFTGLDLEMAIDQHYHEVFRVLDSTFKAIFKHIYDNYRHEIEIVKRQFPHEDLVWLDKTPVLPFAEAIRMLNETGHLGENGKPLPEDEDLGTRDEIALGAAVKAKYGTDYYVLDKFPASARPFYAIAPPPNVTEDAPLAAAAFKACMTSASIEPDGAPGKSRENFTCQPCSGDN